MNDSTAGSTLVADIGGTNARFALANGDGLLTSSIATYACADYPHIFDAINEYLADSKSTNLKKFCFAVAGPIVNNTVDFLNNHWQISGKDVERRFQLDRATLLNDFLAAAYALNSFQSEDVVQIGKSQKLESRSEQTLCVVGPGSGLGVAGLRTTENQILALESEGGHAGFSPIGELQFEVLRWLKNKYDRVSNERVLSGPGIENLYAALSEINGLNNPTKTASEISATQSEPICAQTLQLFFEILGQVAGDTVLTFGAFDGAFIGGGIAPRFPELLAQSAFRKGFERKGRYAERMQAVPTYLITHPYPGLLGASVYANSLNS